MYEESVEFVEVETSGRPHSHPLKTGVINKNNISGTTLGARLDGKDLVNDNYIVAINKCLDILTTRIYKPWLIFDFIFNLSSYKKKLSNALETVFSLSEQVSGYH